jgi:predicted AlkP superfamily phosphohydrolase/phosphomutase
MGRHYDGGHLIKAALQAINRTLPVGLNRAEVLEAYRAVADGPAASATGIQLAPDGLPVAAQVRSFVVPNNDAFAGIRINLIGREPFGRVRPGREADAYIEALITALGALTIGEGGPPAFGRIFRTEVAYPERGADDALPDIIAQWSRLAPYRALHAPAIGTISGEYKGVRTGDHREGGRLFVAGRGVTPGRLPAAPIEAIAPTICAALGVRLANVDGAPIDLPGAADRAGRLPRRARA